MTLLGDSHVKFVCDMQCSGLVLGIGESVIVRWWI